MQAINNYYISIETTGLNPRFDDICEIAILNDAAEIVYHSVVNPVRDSGTYPESEITAEMRENAPKWSEIEPEVRQILAGNRVFAWDLSFTVKFIGAIENGFDVQDWFTKRDDKYPASLRGWTWEWHQRGVFKCQMIIGCLNRWVDDYLAEKETKALENRKDIFWFQWQLWNRISTKWMTDADERRYTKWLLGYEPITKTFFGQLFSRYWTQKGNVCARVEVVALKGGDFVLVDTVGWLKDEKKIAKITDWLSRNGWVKTGNHYKTPLTKEWKAVMKALRNSACDNVCYHVFIEKMVHVK